MQQKITTRVFMTITRFATKLWQNRGISSQVRTCELSSCSQHLTFVFVLSTFHVERNGQQCNGSWKTSNWMKKRSERRKHCALAVVSQSKKFCPAAVPHRRTESAMAVVRQSQNFSPGKDRCMQFRGIVVTDTARPPTLHKHTDRTDYNTLCR